MVDGKQYDLDVDFHLIRRRLTPHICSHLATKTFGTASSALMYYVHKTDPLGYTRIWFTVQYNPQGSPPLRSVS